MPTDSTQSTMDRYFDLMNRDADFAVCYSPDVTWLIADTGEVVEGPDAVRDYVVALHSTFTNARARTYSVGDDHVYLEGDCDATAQEAGVSTCYCVAYDVADGAIAAVRCYGLGARSVR